MTVPPPEWRRDAIIVLSIGESGSADSDASGVDDHR